MAEVPRPGGGGGRVEEGAGTEAFIGKELLKPERYTIWFFSVNTASNDLDEIANTITIFVF